MILIRILPCLAMAATAAAAVPPDHAERMTRGLAMFQQDVAPLLREHCVKCHGGEKTKGDFDLATREGLLKGGAEGVAVKPFDAKGSPMLALMRHEEEPHMPDNKPRLPDADIAKVAAWIEHGAPYGAPLIEGKAPPRNKSVVTAEDRNWWAFQPLARRDPPGPGHPVDAFILASAEGAKFAEPASPRILARRAFLGLGGLPPSPEEVAAFEADPSGKAWDELIARLLDSPAYGERWARHWLDVARFAESSGFEHDYDRPHAFHYRDFVIRALNADMPFNQFARWQVAGDEFAPDDPLALMATGFLGAGVFPTQITANEVERTRYDAMDDMLSTTGSAFLGLTIGCARCHDHKFDPIPMRDYYRMLSTFTTTVRSNVDLELDPGKTAKAKAEHEAEEAKVATSLAEAEAALRPNFDAWLAAGPKDFTPGSWSLLNVTGIKSKGGAAFEKLDDGSWLAGGKSASSDTYTVTATTTGRRVTGLKIEALTHDSFKAKGPGRADNGNFALSSIRLTAEPLRGGVAREVKLVSAEATHEQNRGTLSVASALDADPKSGWAVDFGGIGKDQAAAFIFAEPLDSDGGAKLTLTLEFAVNTRHTIGRPRFSVTSAAPPRLTEATLPANIAPLAGRLNSLSSDERTALFDWWKQRDAGWRELSGKLAAHRKKKPMSTTPVMVCAEGYKPIVMHSQGAPFLKETHVLRRGDTNHKEDVATLGFMQVLMRGADERRWQWMPPAGAVYSGRRRSFADWMCDVEHGAGALMARVTVNRLWQHHFGKGIVASVNDFGKTGTPPSHPDLLDWLAGELIRNGWRLKPLHRLIMTSAAYRQGAGGDSALFLGMPPRRLEAEAVRDSALAVAGLLDRTMYGAGTLDENSVRRSIYFTVKRSRLVNSMLVFDAPEPLVSQGSRPTTTVAPQALLMMNSPQSRRWAKAFAARVEREARSMHPETLVTRAWLLALGRKPSSGEAADAVKYLATGITSYAEAGHKDALPRALTDLCQAIFALNEFVYVE